MHGRANWLWVVLNLPRFDSDVEEAIFVLFSQDLLVAFDSAYWPVVLLHR